MTNEMKTAIARRAARMVAKAEDITAAIIMQAMKDEMAARERLALELLENKTERAKAFRETMTEMVYEAANA